MIKKPAKPQPKTTPAPAPAPAPVPAAPPALGPLQGTSLELKRPDGRAYLTAQCTGKVAGLWLLNDDGSCIAVVTDPVNGNSFMFYPKDTTHLTGAPFAISHRDGQLAIQVADDTGKNFAWIDHKDLFALSQLDKDIKVSAAAIAAPPENWEEILRNNNFTDEDIEKMKVRGFPIVTVITLLASLGPLAYKMIKYLLDNWKA